jgi:putative sigma-54 modulation protein
MQLELRVRNANLVDALRAYVERRLRFALDRFDNRISRITVRVDEFNGPRGGVDKHCRMQVDVLPSGTLRVEERQADLVAAIDRAAHRLNRLVARELQIRRTTKN